MADLPESEFPLRLIDIQGTLSTEGGLCFYPEPKDWNFYIISHTWSRAIRELSEYIGEKILQKKSSVRQGTKESMRGYNAAFQNADLRSKQGYLELRKFLEVLMQEEGVKENPSIWFDVICINQQDTDEKDRDIRRMAAYYKQSKGCYVLTHGVGQGYHLWPKLPDNSLRLSRWFTRVWTLQEFVLPKKVMFLVEGFKESTATWANQYIETFGPRLCDCWLSSSGPQVAGQILTWRDFHHGELMRSEKLESLRLRSQAGSGASALVFDPLLCNSKPQAPAVVNILRSIETGLINMLDASSKTSMDGVAKFCSNLSGYQINTSFLHDNYLGNSSGGRREDVRCECGSTFSQPGKVKSGAINFVESAAYFVLLVMDSMDLGSSPNAVLLNVLQNLKKMLGLRLRLQMEEGEGFAAMMEALDERECTVEEDRVLGIMGLLGLQDSKKVKQLRTGKGLKEQLVNVANCMPHDKLIKLVAAASDRPHFFNGMSWAPVLSRAPFAGSSRVYPVIRLESNLVGYQIPRVQHSVHVFGVSEDGLLNLKGKLVRARLIPDQGTGHLGLVGAGITPHLPYCGGCGRVHVDSHAVMRFWPKHACHIRVLPCPHCFDRASPFAPSIDEFYHAVAEYELQVEGRALPVPINVSAHYFTNAFTLFMRGQNDEAECYVQLPISPSRNFEGLLINASVNQTMPRKVNRRHGPFQYFVPIDVSLLLLGSSCDGKKRVAMVCIGEQHRLHRIGLFHFSTQVGDAIFGDTPDTTHCSVGSLDLTLFIEKIFFLGLSNTYGALSWLF